MTRIKKMNDRLDAISPGNNEVKTELDYSKISEAGSRELLDNIDEAGNIILANLTDATLEELHDAVLSSENNKE